jgi:hypothetical protein
MNATVTKRFVACCLAVLFAAGSFNPLFAQQTSQQTFIIDTPTTGMLDYGSFDLNFRLFSDGGVLTRLNFGVFKIVNLGVGWELSRVIGSDNITVGPPALYLKIRPFSGTLTLPAFAIGYDGQGYFYDRDRKEFLQKERGIFAAVGKEIFIPGLELNIGANINDYSTNTVYGFANLSLNIEDQFMLLAEYDNVNYLPDARVNLGLRFAVTKDLTIDLAGRDIGAAGRKAERIVRINYLGKF